MTELERLKMYMYPYYQTVEDEVMLNDYNLTYTRAEASASVLWSISATQIWSGNIKSFSTGAESTSFQSLIDVTKFCIAQAKVYDRIEKKNRRVGSMMGTVTPVVFVGGVSNEYL